MNTYKEQFDKLTRAYINEEEIEDYRRVLEEIKNASTDMRAVRISAKVLWKYPKKLEK